MSTRVFPQRFWEEGRSTLTWVAPSPGLGPGFNELDKRRKQAEYIGFHLLPDCGYTVNTALSPCPMPSFRDRLYPQTVSQRDPPPFIKSFSSHLFVTAVRKYQSQVVLVSSDLKQQKTTGRVTSNYGISSLTVQEDRTFQIKCQPLLCSFCFWKALAVSVPVSVAVAVAMAVAIAVPVAVAVAVPVAVPVSVAVAVAVAMTVTVLWLWPWLRLCLHDSTVRFCLHVILCLSSLCSLFMRTAAIGFTHECRMNSF